MFKHTHTTFLIQKSFYNDIVCFLNSMMPFCQSFCALRSTFHLANVRSRFCQLQGIEGIFVHLVECAMLVGKHLHSPSWKEHFSHKKNFTGNDVASNVWSSLLYVTEIVCVWNSNESEWKEKKNVTQNEKSIMKLSHSVRFSGAQMDWMTMYMPFTMTLTWKPHWVFFFFASFFRPLDHFMSCIAPSMTILIKFHLDKMILRFFLSLACDIYNFLWFWKRQNCNWNWTSDEINTFLKNKQKFDFSCFISFRQEYRFSSISWLPDPVT